MMKKVIFNEYGNFDQLQIAETEMPVFRKNELLIRVKAVGINPLDWKILEGQMRLMTGSKFPKGIGFDFSGVVEKTGDAVSQFKVGDEVFGAMDAMRGAALAEFLVVSEKTVFNKPAALSFETAAAMPSVGVAALRMFEKADAKAGSEVLINGATGGIGVYAVQMAQKMGLKVTAVASGKGLPFLEKWQADRIIDYKKENILAQNLAFDAILEMSGTLPYAKAKAMMKPKSVFVSTLPDPKLLATSFFNNLFSNQKHKIIFATPTQHDLQTLADWANNGLETVIEQTFAFSDFMSAYQAAKKGGGVGKVVIHIP